MKLNVKQLKSQFQDFVWGTAEEQYPPVQRAGIIALRVLALLVRELKEGQLSLRAMGLVYTTLLAIVPLIAVSFSVLKGFGVHNQVEPLLLGIMEPLGDKGVEITEKIIGFVDNIKAGVLGTLGLALLIYTVVSLLQKVERAFNFTWRVTTHRPLVQRFSDYITIILIGPVLIFSALGVTASITNIEFVQQVLKIEVIGVVFSLFGYLLPFFLIVIIFTLVYKLVPNATVTLKSALVGAFVAGVLWQTNSWAFTNFVVGSTKYTAIYSAFATLIIFMIWLYLNWLILLVGGTIAFYFQHQEHRSLRDRTLLLSNRLREKIMLHVMVLVSSHYIEKKPVWTVNSLLKELHINGEVCERMIERLERSGLLVRTADQLPGLLPAYAVETMKVSEVIRCARESGENSSFSLDSLPANARVDTVYAGMEEAIYARLGNMTMHELCCGSYDKTAPE